MESPESEDCRTTVACYVHQTLFLHPQSKEKKRSGYTRLAIYSCNSPHTGQHSPSGVMILTPSLQFGAGHPTVYKHIVIMWSLLHHHTYSTRIFYWWHTLVTTPITATQLSTSTVTITGTSLITWSKWVRRRNWTLYSSIILNVIRYTVSVSVPWAVTADVSCSSPVQSKHRYTFVTNGALA